MLPACIYTQAMRLCIHAVIALISDLCLLFLCISTFLIYFASYCCKCKYDACMLHEVIPCPFFSLILFPIAVFSKPANPSIYLFFVAPLHFF